MDRSSELIIDGVIERKDDSLPCYVIVPAFMLQPWNLEETTVVEGWINGFRMGRRGLKRWDEERWFLEISRNVCDMAAIKVGDRVELRIGTASTELPRELADLIERNRPARQCWERMTASQRRMLREQVLAARRSSTRERRARKALLGAEER